MNARTHIRTPSWVVAAGRKSRPPGPRRTARTRPRPDAISPSSHTCMSHTLHTFHTGNSRRALGSNSFVLNILAAFFAKVMILENGRGGRGLPRKVVSCRWSVARRVSLAGYQRRVLRAEASEGNHRSLLSDPPPAANDPRVGMTTESGVPDVGTAGPSARMRVGRRILGRNDTAEGSG